MESTTRSVTLFNRSNWFNVCFCWTRRYVGGGRHSFGLDQYRWPADIGPEQTLRFDCGVCVEDFRREATEADQVRVIGAPPRRQEPSDEAARLKPRDRAGDAALGVAGIEREAGRSGPDRSLASGEGSLIDMADQSAKHRLVRLIQIREGWQVMADPSGID
jgi:hypothetical protein